MSDACEIPAWLVELLPQPKQPTRVFLDDKGAVCAKHPDSSISTFGKDLVEAYDALKGDDIDLVFADEVYQHFSPPDSEVSCKEIGAIWVPFEEGKASRMLLSLTDDDRYCLLKWAWEEFKAKDAAWRSDVNFFNSWHWLDAHPAFWTRSYPYHSDDPKWKESMLWDWETEGYCQKIYLVTMQADDGSVVVALELGAHVPESDKYLEAVKEAVIVADAYQEHYHDYRLDIYAATYEEAIIAAARSVDKFYNMDGSEKPGVHYEPSELEKELEQSIKETDGCLDRSHKDWRDTLPRVAFADYGEWTRKRFGDC